MKTAVSLPDHVYRDADRLARRMHKTRSRIYTEALELYLSRHDANGITDALNAVHDERDAQLAPDLRAAATRTLWRSEW
ncbi:MAG: hypothetical protein KA205_03755 [Acidobacteria bacterium]|jgi:predicted transcriptional regulator|nr:hypothetical protein [Acidobacteriota bacterium]